MSDVRQGSPGRHKAVSLAILAAPVAWGAQLILGWWVASSSCAEGATATPIGATATRGVLIAVDAAAILICAAAIWIGVRAWRHSEDSAIHAVQGREPVDFLAAVALLIGGIFLVATALQAIPTFSLPVCAKFL